MPTELAIAIILCFAEDMIPTCLNADELNDFERIIDSLPNDVEGIAQVIKDWCKRDSELLELLPSSGRGTGDGTKAAPKDPKDYIYLLKNQMREKRLDDAPKKSP